MQGNYYESKAELMQIAPLDHLWVWGSVSELDADKVEVGQKIKVMFPYSDRTIEDEVEYIDKAIDPETRARQVPRVDPQSREEVQGRHVRQGPPRDTPQAGTDRHPARSMVSVDRLDFVFLKLPGAEHRFERRHVFVDRETSDWVIVAAPSTEHAGLKPDEQVVTNGSLILEQMFEDQLTLEGETSKERPMDDEAFGKPEKPISITAP